MGPEPTPVELHFSNGEIISAFRSFSFREAFTDPLGSVSLEVAPLRDEIPKYRSLVQKGEGVTLHVAGKQQGAFIIETVRMCVSKDDGFTISADATSTLQSVYYGGVSDAATRSFQADAPLEDFVREVLAPFGFTRILMDDDVAVIKSKTGVNPNCPSTPAAKLRMKHAQVQLGEPAYTFLARVLTRLGVMLRADVAAGGVHVTAPHLTGDPLYTLVCGPPGTTVDGDRFFGEGVTTTDTNAGQFSFAEVLGVADDDVGDTRSNTPRARVESSEINPRRPPFRSTAKLHHKPKYIRDANCRDNKTARSVAKLTLALGAESAFTVSGTVDGLVSKDGIPWTVDTLARVQVPQHSVDEVLWMSERTMRIDKAGGQRCSVSLIPPGNFVIGEIG